MKFSQKLAAKYQVKSENENKDVKPGSAHPENWQTSVQSGKSAMEMYQDANKLVNIVTNWQSDSLLADDIFKLMTKNDGKFLHLYTPVLTKGLSRSKLLAISEICQRLADLSSIV